MELALLTRLPSIAVKRHIITQEDFDQLLSWLHSDREQAGQRYEEIRTSLIKFLVWGGCWEAEDVADDTINRVAEKVSNIRYVYEGEPSHYFFGVAKNLLREWKINAQRSPIPLSVLVADDSSDRDFNEELQYKALEECLQNLSRLDRELILAYYSREKYAKIDTRKDLASRTNLTTNALRVKVHRIRQQLEKCIQRKIGKVEEARSSSVTLPENRVMQK